MFKKLFIVFMIAPICLLASGKYLSPLPTPSIEVLNIDIEKCNSSCLRSFLSKGQVFSFIANFNKNNANDKLSMELNTLLNTLEITEVPYFLTLQKPFFNIALVFPRKTIGRYSSATTNVILSYLLNQKGRFNFEIFDSKTESLEDMQEALQMIYSKGYRQVIAVVTQEGAKMISMINPDLQIFIPSVHQSQVFTENGISKNLIFGGISYDEQIQVLSEISANTPVASFYDDSMIGRQMQEYTQAANTNLAYSKSFSAKQSANFHKEMQSLRSTLRGKRIFLNTPVTSSSIILSQLTYHGINPKGVYSTQINYSPSLLSITQERDRNNMYIANSIMPLDGLLLENAKLLNVDLEYNWINYATAFGIEYFYSKNVPGAKRYFKEKVRDNQVQYNIELLTPQSNRFMSFNP